MVILYQIYKYRENLDTRELLIVFGLCFQILIQSYFHILSNLAIVPTKGVTLPFMSFGGSSLITHGISIGIILSLLKKQINI